MSTYATLACSYPSIFNCSPYLPIYSASKWTETAVVTSATAEATVPRTYHWSSSSIVTTVQPSRSRLESESAILGPFLWTWIEGDILGYSMTMYFRMVHIFVWVTCGEFLEENVTTTGLQVPWSPFYLVAGRIPPQHSKGVAGSPSQRRWP